MDHRKSLTLAGAADEDLLALRDHDTSFYGLDSDLELSSDDSDSDAEPAEKIPLLAEPEASSGDEILIQATSFYLGNKTVRMSQRVKGTSLLNCGIVSSMGVSAKQTTGKSYLRRKFKLSWLL